MPAKKIRFRAQDFPKKGFQTIQSRLFTLKFSENTFMHNRFAIVVGVAVDKRSSRRNTVRRRIREWARRSPNIRSDFLFIVRPEAARAPRELLYAELQNAFCAIYNTKR